jgi:HPt (histidine-containing phosphotransfer) domain-containing protein
MAVLDPTPAPAEPAPTVAVKLDPAVLARLQMLDPQGRDRLLERAAEAFETLLQRVLPPLDAALAGGGLASIAPLAHTLRSATAALGASAVADDCAAIESTLRQGRDEGVAERAQRLRAELPAVLAAVRSVAARRDGADALRR